MLGFGKVSEDCLNGTGRVFNSKLPILVPLSADSVKESKLTSVFVYNDSAKGIIGNYTSTLGYYESLELRKELSWLIDRSYMPDDGVVI